MRTKLNVEELRTVFEYKEILHNAIDYMTTRLLIETPNQKKTTRQNIRAYQFGLRLLNNLPETLKSNVSDTTYSINIGEIGELAIKYFDNTNKRIVRVSTQGLNDRDTQRKHEVKTITSDRKANGLNRKLGFYATIQGTKKVIEGVYWISSNEHNYKKNEKISHTSLSNIINDYNIPLDDKTYKLGL